MNAMTPTIAQELKDVVAFEKGKPPAQQPYFGHDAELYLTPEYLRGGEITEPIKASSNAVRVSDGDTIVLWDGSNAGEVFRGRKGVLSSTMTRLKQRDSFDREYFFYAVKQWEPFLKGQTSGSGIPHVDKEVLGKLRVLDFARPEQTKIAEILSAVDRAIEQTEALVAKQLRIKTGLMQNLFTRGIDENGNLRSEKTDKFKDSPLGRVPLEWGVEAIEGKLECIIDYRGRTPLKTVAGIPLVTAKNVRDGFLSEEPREFIASENFNSWMTRGIPKPGDVMFTTEAPMGNVARVPEYRIALAQRLITLPVKETELSSTFLFWILHWSRTRERLELLTSGSTVVGVKQSVFRKVLFCFPSREEQDRLTRVLNAHDALAANEKNRLDKLRLLKTALMQDLLTGKKRVTPLLEPEVIAK